jgi:NAD(P)-dependent dehydrogenase (short-subunit alcohol dehydrogenase family)
MDMQGRTCIVTGATSGIGRATATALNRAGARLVLVARNAEKAEQARRELLAERPGAEVSIQLADLAKLDDIRAVVPALLDECPQIDVLLNNAGIVLLRRTETQDGFESMFGVNHLAYYLLTRLLLERLKENPQARIVNVSSEAHRFASWDFDDLQSKKSFSGMRVYGNSKLANILFTRALAKRLEGTGVTANCLHPGAVDTNLGHGNGLLFQLIQPLARFFLRSPEDGAKTSIKLCASPEVAGTSGLYFQNEKPRRPTALALDDEAAERLWRISAEMVGLPA